MPLYRVKSPDEVRLIDAPNAAQAVRHVARAIITAEVAKPLEIHELASQGVSIEKAGSDE